jgi:hypothetical protein
MISTRLQLIVALMMVLAPGAFPAFAAPQNDAPTREGNIWDWRNHEPVPSEVQKQEQSQGIALPNGQQKKENDDVESLYRQLMKNNGQQ